MGVTTCLPLLSTRAQTEPTLELWTRWELNIMAWMFVTLPRPSHMLKPFPSPSEASGGGLWEGTRII